MKLQAEMFEEAGKVGSLEVQLVYFRGFNECRASRWVSETRALRDLMTGIDCRGGQTQIGKVLAHARKETGKKKVSALVFVGDALEEPIDDLAAKAGELGMLGVRLFAFQEGRDPTVERGFRELARLTGGAYARFDPNAAAELAQLLRAAAIYAAGGLKALAREPVGPPSHRADQVGGVGYLAAGGLVLLLAYGVVRLYTSIDPAALARAVRYGIGVILLLVAGRPCLRRAMGCRHFCSPSAAYPSSRAAVSGRSISAVAGGIAGTTSTVRSDWFEMRLDHDSGAMTGTVRRGAHAGASLDDLEIGTVLGLRDVAADEESLALLEAYLDRRVPGWREDVEGDGAAGAGGAADSGAMTDQQAYEILGLLPGASEMEIRAAHRRLMKRVHPDQGGSTFLAAKINQAKDWLLSKHH